MRRHRKRIVLAVTLVALPGRVEVRDLWLLAMHERTSHGGVHETEETAVQARRATATERQMCRLRVPAGAQQTRRVPRWFRRGVDRADRHAPRGLPRRAARSASAPVLPELPGEARARSHRPSHHRLDWVHVIALLLHLPRCSVPIGFRKEIDGATLVSTSCHRSRATGHPRWQPQGIAQRRLGDGRRGCGLDIERHTCGRPSPSSTSLRLPPWEPCGQGFLLSKRRSGA